MGQNIVPSDSPSIFAALKTAAERQALVRPSNPPSGVCGYIFDIIGDERTELTSEITPHFVEDNTAIEDMIALNPERITLGGTVAELVALAPVSGTVAKTGNPLPLNPALSPTVTPGTAQAEGQASAAAAAQSGAINGANDLFDYFNGRAPQQPNETKQSKIFEYFYQLWLGRVLCTVETPNGIWTNLAISSFRSYQSENSRSSSDFTITFMKIRTARTVTVNLGQLAGRALQQRTPTAQNGNANVTPLTAPQTQSFLRAIAPHAFTTNPP